MIDLNAWRYWYFWRRVLMFAAGVAGLVSQSALVAAVVAVAQRGLPATADPATFLREIGPLWTATFALATLVYHEVLKRQGWLGAGEGSQSRGDSGLVG